MSAGTARIGGAPRTVRLVHAGVIPFSRTITTSEQRARMPEGTTLALELDPRGDVTRVAVERISPARTTILDPKTPSSGAALVGLFEVRRVIEKHESRLLLDGQHQPEFVVGHGHELIALWRSLDAGQFEMTLRSEAYQFAPAPVRLRAKNVATIRGELRPLPNLSVKVVVPDDARDAWQALEPSLSVRRTADKKEVRSSKGQDHDFSLLPLDTYEVALTAKPWTFVRSADLTSGTDAAVEFELAPFTISGTVTAGNDPKAASVTFRRGNGDATTVRTNARGEYEATLWTNGMYIVEAAVEGSKKPPFTRLYRLSTTRRLDVQVPQTQVSVVVTDAVTGEPIANARVTTINRWQDPDSRKGSTSHHVITDAHGVALLAPLSEGIAEIHVAADGYFKDDPATIPVQKELSRTIAVSMRRETAGNRVRVVLPNAAPAAEAELLAVGDPSGLAILWSGRADGDGRVSVPQSLAAAILLVRHPAAAGHARRIENVPDVEIRLAPSSPQPIVLRAERRGEPVRSARITVWYGALPISSAALQFLTRTPSATSAAGDWVGNYLPAGPLRVLASSGRIDGQIAAGAYDALATVVPDPRPNQVVLTVVD